MTFAEVMEKLEAMGTARNRRTYSRHGVTAEMFGVSFADLGKLAKAIRKDQNLAEKLWGSGNHDARILACMVADADAIKASVLETWAKDLDDYLLSDAYSGPAGRSPHGRKLAEKWIGSGRKKEFPAATAWIMIGRLAGEENDLSDDYFEGHLRTIEAEIHGSLNRVRYSMNTALISIGSRNAALEKKALAAAKRIGKVEVDHGETGCRTPDAAAYILKMKAHRAGKRKT